VRGTVADAPLLEADHGRGGAGPGATRGEDAHTEMRRRKLSEEPRTVTNVHVVPPSLSSRRRLQLRPAVRTSISPFSCAALILDSMLVGVPSSRRASCTSRRRSSIDGRRVTPHRCEPGTVATSGRNAGCS
jgi:hypothetical protein